MDMIRIGAAGITGVLLAVQLKQMKSEYAVYVSLAACILFFTLRWDGFLSSPGPWRQSRAIFPSRMCTCRHC